MFDKELFEKDMRKENLEKYLGKWVFLAIPHYYEKDRLFLYAGYLTQLDENELTLRNKDGEEIILSYSLIKSFILVNIVILREAEVGFEPTYIRLTAGS